MSHVVALLQDKNGFEREYEYEVEKQYADNQAFMWEMGNYCCDCNRSIFLYANEAEELDCNIDKNAIRCVSLMVDGKEVYHEGI